MIEDKENNSELSTAEKCDRLCRLPLSRIKHIVKLDPEVGITSREAVFVIAKATVCQLTFILFLSLTLKLQKKVFIRKYKKMYKGQKCI